MPTSLNATPARPILILDHDDTIVAVNRSFAHFLTLLQHWALCPAPLLHKAGNARGKHIGELLNLHSALPQLEAGQVDRRSVPARFGELDSRLGLRGVQWGDEQRPYRSLYWRRFSARSDLVDRATHCGIHLIRLRELYKNSHTPTWQRLDELASQLLRFAMAPMDNKLRSLCDSALAEQFERICELIPGCMETDPQQTQPLQNALHEHMNTLRQVIRTFEEIRAKAEDNHQAAESIDEKSRLSMLASRLMWLEAISAGESEAVASLSVQLHDFSRNGLDSARDMSRMSRQAMDRHVQSTLRLCKAFDALQALNARLTVPH